MLRTNRDRLIKMAVMGKISSPIARKLLARSAPKGESAILPSVGGIAYNLRVGDLAVGWQADHAEPGVSLADIDKEEINKGAEDGLSLLSCIGNEAIVSSGEAKGTKGHVTGKHGGINHILVDFPPEVKENLVIGTPILIKAFGVGLRLLDFEDVTVMNIDPDLLDAIPAEVIEDKIDFPVTHLIPATLMGLGGAQAAYSGDYDIQLFDKTLVDAYHLDDLRLGDLVAIVETNHVYRRPSKKEVVSVGVIVHCDSVISGHGPGVTTLMVSANGKIVPRIEPQANIAQYLNIR